MKNHIAKYKPDGHYIDIDGWEVYVQNSEYHRLGGPAIIQKGGIDEYWFKGNYYPEIKTDIDWYRYLDTIYETEYILATKKPLRWTKKHQSRKGKKPSLLKWLKNGWSGTKNSNCERQHYTRGKRHNDDGPAIVYMDGNLEWWQNDKRKK